MNFENEKKIINKIEKEKKEYIEELIKLNIISKDFFKKINEIVLKIETNMKEIEKDDILDMLKISKLLNQLILDKVFLTKQINSINYFKWKYDVVKSNTKLKIITESYKDGEIIWRWNNSDLVTIKLDNLSSFQNLIQDILVKIKNVKDLIDTTIMVLQSQLKNISFEYINAWKVKF